MAEITPEDRREAEWCLKRFTGAWQIDEKKDRFILRLSEHASVDASSLRDLIATALASRTEKVRQEMVDNAICNTCHANYAPMCSICYDKDSVAKLAEKEEEIKRLYGIIDGSIKTDLDERVATLTAEVGRLREMLKRYGQHLGPGCADYMGGTGNPCNCGLDSALSSPPAEAGAGA